MAYSSMNEFFGYGSSLDRPPFQTVGVQEIVDPRYHEAYQNLDYREPGYPGYRPYNGRVQYEPRQFYFDDRDPPRYHNHNDRADYTTNPIPFPIPAREEYHSHPISVPIRLSVNPQYINLNSLRFAFEGYGLDGNVLTVTGYPSNRRNGAHEFLATVRNLTGDGHARLAR